MFLTTADSTVVTDLHCNIVFQLMPSPRQRTIRPRYNPGHQALLVKKLFPSFSCHGRCGNFRFQGVLQPRPDGDRYLVEITYRRSQMPEVRVISPALHEDAPHLFPDDSLCLFHPSIFRWNDGFLVATHIIPWTAAWLFFYEGWLRLGVWLGPEAPHPMKE